MVGAVQLPQINSGSLVYNIVSTLIGILAMWLAAKVLVPQQNATFGNVMKVWLLNICLVIGIIFASVALTALAIAMHDKVRTLLMFGGFLVLVLCLIVLIPMKVYSIGGGRAIGTLLLTFAIHFGILAAVLLGAAAVWGQDRVLAMTGQKEVLARLQSQIAQLQGRPAPAGQLGQAAQAEPVSFNFFGSSAPPPASSESATEIDGLLNAALHPVGPKPPLEAREELTRTLQQKLQAEKNSLVPGDARALLVYQNQLNRYLLLLDQVKAERKAQTMTMPAQRDASFARPVNPAVAARPH